MQYFLLLSLILSAAAFPRAHHGIPALQKKSGTSIPLRSRSTLTAPDGVFDKSLAIAATVGTINKHRQNMINLEKNLGPAAFNLGAVIKPVATLPVHILEHLLKKRQAEALTDEDEDIEWAGNISIGPLLRTSSSISIVGSNFHSAGSSDLWVPSASCTSTVCASKKKYSAASSTTAAIKQGSTFSIEYGDGSTVSGTVYTDTVTVAGVKATTQTFSAVTTLSSDFTGNPADGILGLAFPSISNLASRPFFPTAFSQRAVPQNIFGFFLASNGSELYLGGTNSKLYSGSLEFHTINSTSGFWQVPGASVKGLQTVIDSGTTLIYGPPATVQEMCLTLPMRSTGAGADWNITAANFNLGLTAVGSSQCVGAIVGEDMGLGSNVWLLGDSRASFMKNVYTAFDFNSSAVGFAALRS
ncbi:acid protease [Roridomyces roridus]|uniref:Acid protease n=1 Tax=Roridomyces roridus TaxID=1738132 RepID=A0AAD7BW80_9AGAR|nr:acid protease [Roridomyces roridus]